VRPTLTLAVAVTALAAPAARAVDLTRIDRTIAKEPAYQTKSPKYGLLVFGPEATHRVWVVLDGQALYLDRNGNGDLTDDGAPLASAVEEPRVDRPSYQFRALHKFDLGDLKFGGRIYAGVGVMHTLIKPDCKPDDRDTEEMLNAFRKDPGLTRVGFTVRVGQVRHQCVARFADRPADAPVLHFDGPLTLAPLEDYPELVRGDKPADLRFVVGCRGTGFKTFTILDYDEIPNDVNPRLDIEYPAKEPGKPPVKSRVQLGRC